MEGKLDDSHLPISLESARRHLRLGDYQGDDEVVLEKLAIAIAVAEDYTNRPIKQIEKMSASGEMVKVGYDKNSLPGGIKGGVLLILGMLYDNESDVVIGRITSQLPWSAKMMLKPHRVIPYR